MSAAFRCFVRDHPIAMFLPLAFLLSWYPWFIALVQGRQTGPNPLGPLLAAMIVTGVGFGWPAFRAFLASIVRARVGPRWYALAFGLPMLLVLASVLLNSGAGAPWPTPKQLSAWPQLLDRFLFILLFIALGEEPGWRGFLLPRLQARFGSIHASWLLGAIWALWHLPLIGHEFPVHLVIPFLISVFAGTFVLTRLYLGTKGSVLLPMLMHATINTVGAGFAFGFVQDADLVRLWWIYAVLWGLAATVAAWTLRTRGATS